jgi:uncharacterized protein (DUF2147 family)
VENGKQKLKMMGKKLLLLFLLLVGMATIAQAQTKSDAIVGEWMNEKKDAKFQIFKKENKYYGKIIWGTGDQKKDTKNPDAKLRNRDLIGLVILNHFVFDGDATWENGTIYDPREGKTYSCKITLKSNDKLNVRGFVGLSMFGRTEMWTRIK